MILRPDAIINYKIRKNSFSAKNTAAEKGAEYLKIGKFDEAVNVLHQALQTDPKDKDIHLNLARAYTYKKQDKLAIPHYQEYLKQEPEDLEVGTLLGIAYKNTGLYKLAEDQFQEVLKKEPKYDYASRELKETKNYELGISNPKQAYIERNQAAFNNLKESLKNAQQYLPKKYFESLQDLSITFDNTAKMSGRSNIAQYEHNKKKITITNDYVYAHPNLVTAYLIHEFVHAKDNDPYTSIKEEQDAYKIQTEYWIKNSQGIKDPEMDFATKLYKESPDKLADRVAEIYRLRSPGIAETSYNHIYSKRLFSSKLSTYGIKPKALDIIA